MPAKNPRVLYRHQLYRGPRATGKRQAPRRPELTIAQILAWADQFHREHGSWPKKSQSGPVARFVDDTWCAVEQALNKGRRGLPGNSSLARLLAEHRGVRNKKALPPLTVKQILLWADQHHQRTGEWPISKSGRILDSHSETWATVDHALFRGTRGLAGGTTLARLLTKHRGVANHLDLPRFSPELILTWADKHFQRTGQWPTSNTGAVVDAPGEKWSSVRDALLIGQRGFEGGSSLARFLAEHRGKRNHMALPPLSVTKILRWADSHCARTGQWPTSKGVPIADALGETWSGVNAALVFGRRGLPGGSSVARLLAKHRGKRNGKALPHLSPRLVLMWADNHFKRTGKWPTKQSGPIADASGETWCAIDNALRAGNRGFPGGSTPFDC